MNQESKRTKILIGIILLNLVVIAVLSVVLILDKATQINEEDYIKKSLIREYATRYNSRTAIFRKLFPDELVYLDDEQLVFDTIDSDLRLHEYDWSNLTITDTQYDYNSTKVTTYQGVDVSKFSGDVDWKSVRQSGIHFAMLRVGYRGYTEGKIYTDEYFHKNAKEAYDAGIKVGVYFYSQAITQAEAREEAAYVLNEIKDLNISYPIVFDMEKNSSSEARANQLNKDEVTGITIAFCEAIKEAGYTPMIYGNSNWMFAKLDLDQLKEYDKWYAQYGTEPYYPYEFTMWQYTEKGTVPGINGNADRNISFTDYAN